MARRSRSSRRRINYLHIVFWALSFAVALSMVLALLPLTR
jgi:hypothetical protein